MVTVEGSGVDNVAVTLNNGMVTTTSGGGNYSFTAVDAGLYTVTISEFPEDASFETTTGSATIESADQIAVVNFSGNYIRTASISGLVSVEGNGMSDVTVKLTGVSEATTVTSADGEYQFGNLRKGAYVIEISGFDENEISFSGTSQNTAVGVSEAKVISFDGSYLRTASILGEVTVGEQPLAGVMITATGHETNRSATTDAAGQYAIESLRAGDYQVDLSGYDSTLYRFDDATATVSVARNEKTTVNFAGTKTRTASISGILYLDENEKNDSYDEGREEMLEVAGVTIVLNGPSVSDQTITQTNDEGRYLFDSLEAGQYRVLLSPEQDSTLSANALEGLKYGGSATGTVIKVEGNSENSVHIPFDITHQLVVVQARMGDGKNKVGGPIPDATISLYATANNAIQGRAPLGTLATDKTGTATFYFPRDDDSDNLVFATLDSLGHADLGLVGSGVIEIGYNNGERLATATPFYALNTRAAIHFRVKNILTAAGGDAPQVGWAPEVVIDTTNPVPLGGTRTQLGGFSTFTATHEVDSLPVTYFVSVADDQPDEVVFRESFLATPEPSPIASSVVVGQANKGYLTYVHDGLAPPDKIADLGVVRVRFTTQTLLVGVHRERDHIPGFSYLGSLLGNDDRGHLSELLWIEIELLYRDDNGDDVLFTHPDPNHDINYLGNPRGVNIVGLVGFTAFANLPIDLQFIVRYSLDEEAVSSRIYAPVGSGRADAWRGTDTGFQLGAFGEHGGTTPLVFLCPQSTEFSISSCSTFGYLAVDRSVVAQAMLLSPLLGLGDGNPKILPKVTWRLIPDERYNLSGSSERIQIQIDSVQPTPDDLPGVARFANVPEGKWSIVAESAHEDFVVGDTTPFVLHLASDDTQLESEVFELSGVFLNTTVSGRLVNNRVDQAENRATQEETASGVEMDLYSLRIPGVTDTITTVRTETYVASTTTGDLGEYSFDRVPEGWYMVRARGTDVIVYSGEEKDGAHLSNTPDLVTFWASDQSAGNVSSGTTLPYWDYAASKVAGRDGFNDSGQPIFEQSPDADFIVLFKDGELRGTVGPVAKADSARSVVISALRCQEVATNGNPSTCTVGKYDDPVGVNVSTGKGGAWKIDGLREGYYEMRIAVSSDYVVSGSATQLVLLSGPGAVETVNFTIADPS